MPTTISDAPASPSSIRIALLRKSHDPSSFNTERDRAFEKKHHFAVLNQLHRSSADDIVINKSCLSALELAKSSAASSNDSLISPSSPSLSPPFHVVGGRQAEEELVQAGDAPANSSKRPSMFAKMLQPRRRSVVVQPPAVILTSRPTFSSLHQRRRSELAPAAEDLKARQDAARQKFAALQAEAAPLLQRARNGSGAGVAGE